MNISEQMVVIALCAIVTILTRFLPFILFKEGEEVNEKLVYLEYALPAALFAMLVVYCLKDVDFLNGTFGIPEAASIILIVLIHVKWRNMLLSILCGVASYLVISWIFTIL